MLNGLAELNRVVWFIYIIKIAYMEFIFHIVSNLIIMMFILCVSLSGSYASMLNGLAEFNRVGLDQFYYKSCLNAIQISYRFKSVNYDVYTLC